MSSKRLTLYVALCETTQPPLPRLGRLRPPLPSRRQTDGPGGGYAGPALLVYCRGVAVPTSLESELG